MGIKVGDIVTIGSGAVYAGAHAGKKVPASQLAPKKHGVSQVKGEDALLKEIYSWVPKKYLTVVGGASPAQPAPQQPPQEEAPKLNNEQSTEYSQGLDDAITKMLGSSADKYDKYKNGLRIFGAPYQFLPSADYRPFKDSDIGYSYLENILAEAPIVKIIPGVPNYLPDFSKEQKEAFHNYVASRSAATEISNKITKEEGRYFDFVADYVDYMRYVNLLCRISAVYLGIGDLTVPGTTEKYKSYDWSRYYNLGKATSDNSKNESNGVFEVIAAAGQKVMSEIIGEYRHIQFYVDAGASYNESVSNNTSQSQVTGLFDTAEGLMKDLAFLTSTDGKSDISDLVGSAGSAADFLNEKLTKSNGGAMSRVLGLSAQVLQGSNVIFPEIWGDAAYDKSYSFNLNLTSPYGDAESVFLSIYVPMMHVLAFSLPRQTSANGYTSPFLVKAYSPGWFSCDMGIVNSISIEKGPDKDWSITGLPTTVKISVSIKDLYSNLMISKSSRPELFFNNNSLIEFLAVTCGVDITKPNFMLRLETYVNIITNKIMDIPSSIAQEFIQSITNSLSFLYKL